MIGPRFSVVYPLTRRAKADPRELDARARRSVEQSRRQTDFYDLDLDGTCETDWAHLRAAVRREIALSILPAASPMWTSGQLVIGPSCRGKCASIQLSCVGSTAIRRPQ